MIIKFLKNLTVILLIMVGVFYLSSPIAKILFGGFGDQTRFFDLLNMPSLISYYTIDATVFRLPFIISIIIIIPLMGFLRIIWDTWRPGFAVLLFFVWNEFIGFPLNNCPMFCFWMPFAMRGWWLSSLGIVVIVILAIDCIILSDWLSDLTLPFWGRLLKKQTNNLLTHPISNRQYIKNILLIVNCFYIGLNVAFLFDNYDLKTRGIDFMNTAQQAYNENKYDNARVFIYKSIGADYTSYKPYMLLGMIYEKQHEYKRALDNYEAALIMARKGTNDFALIEKKINELKKLKSIIEPKTPPK
jgi:hypothetical protein